MFANKSQISTSLGYPIDAKNSITLSIDRINLWCQPQLPGEVRLKRRCLGIEDAINSPVADSLSDAQYFKVRGDHVILVLICI